MQSRAGVAMCAFAVLASAAELGVTLKHLQNAQTRFYCPQAFLSLDV